MGPENDRVASLPASEQLRLDYASLPAMVWTLTADGSCDYVNARWLEFTGRQAAAELGDGWTDRLHPEDRAAALSQIRPPSRSGAPFQTRVPDAAARRRSTAGCSTSAAPRFGRDGDSSGSWESQHRRDRPPPARAAPGPGRAGPGHRPACRRHRPRLQQPAHGHHRACRAAAGRAGALGPGPGGPRPDPALRRSRREPDPAAARLQPPPGARAASAGPQPAGGRLPLDAPAAGGRRASRSCWAPAGHLDAIVADSEPARAGAHPAQRQRARVHARWRHARAQHPAGAARRGRG